MDAALLVFAKVPRPGRVKTRLTPTLSPAETARLYTAFLRDTLRQAQGLEVDVRLYVAPPLPDDGFDALPTDMKLYEQEGDGLGERMKRAVEETLHDGYNRVVVMGSDHPTLPLSFLREAFRALKESGSVCVGPTEDGGFYLIGMNDFYPQLFEDMTYSHSEVFADTLARAKRIGAQITVLPQWYDVDTPQDLERMLAELGKADVEAPNTRRITEQLDLRSLLSNRSEPQ